MFVIRSKNIRFEFRLYAFCETIEQVSFHHKSAPSSPTLRNKFRDLTLRNKFRDSSFPKKIFPSSLPHIRRVVVAPPLHGTSVAIQSTRLLLHFTGHGQLRTWPFECRALRSFSTYLCFSFCLSLFILLLLVSLLFLSLIFFLSLKGCTLLHCAALSGDLGTVGHTLHPNTSSSSC